ncbi:MAG: glycosyltransferase family 1 protein [Patescibacteria group bacterium]|nr:glycosyltransferase family 1 protein [Patescibacteria group bacterium]
MKIGIDASRAFLKQRTGIEEYAYQVIKHLRGKLDDHEVFIYVRKWNSGKIDFELPDNWRVKEIPYIYGWTQVGLAFDILFNPIDVFFSPAHTTAIIHPEKTIVTIHGLEYEHCPENYSTYARLFHRFFIKKSCAWATEIIAVSRNTKKDLINLYNAPKEKITVVYNGYERNSFETGTERISETPYVFYIGRLEQRKNIIGIIKAFEILKKRYKYHGSLFLAGNSGHGYDAIQSTIAKSKFKKDIKQFGFISETEKWNYLKYADVFLFPSFCEGFGIPIIEAQSIETPVVTSKIGPLDETAGNDEICVDPYSPNDIAQKAHLLIDDPDFRSNVIMKGKENVKRFSWEKCACSVTGIIERCQ